MMRLRLAVQKRVTWEVVKLFFPAGPRVPVHNRPYRLDPTVGLNGGGPPKGPACVPYY